MEINVINAAIKEAVPAPKITILNKSNSEAFFNVKTKVNSVKAKIGKTI